MLKNTGDVVRHAKRKGLHAKSRKNPEKPSVIRNLVKSKCNMTQDRGML